MPQGLSLSVSLFLALAAFTALGSQRVFCPLVLLASSCPAVMSFVSSRLSFQCWLRSRTPSQWASPESWAPPVQVVVLLLLSQARLWFLQLRQWPQHLQQRPRPVTRWRPLCCAPRLSGPPLPRTRTSFSLSCAAAQTCSTGTASQFQRCFWFAWLCRPRGVGTGHGLGHQELPTGPASPAAPLTRCSRSPLCLGRVAALR